MYVPSCTVNVDATGRELTEHGSAAFPVACYHDPLAVSEVPWHWHEELEAGIIPQFPTVITAGHEKILVNPGEGFFINSGILHGAYAPEGYDSLIHSLVFHPRLIGGNTDSIFYQSYLRPVMGNPTLECVIFKPDIPWHRECLEVIEGAWEYCARKEPGYEFMVRSALSRLVWLLFSHQEKSGHTHSSKTLRDANRIKQMLTYIHEQYGLGLTITSIASSAAISERECLRCFRNTIGISPIQYLKQYRLRQAASRILASEDRVCNIASQCGFQDMSYFSKSFREQYGCSPTLYRDNSKRQP